MIFSSVNTVKPQHLLVSLQSLKSICAKKGKDIHLIDNKELTRLCGAVKTEVEIYQRAQRIPELDIVMQRFPEARSYENDPPLVELASFSYRILGLAIAALYIFAPLYGIILGIVWFIGFCAGWLIMYRHRARIQDDLNQISSCCDVISMLIRNQESFTP